MIDKDILWIFIHLHKTGGTTFNVHLKKEFKKSFVHLDQKEDQINFNKISKKDKENINFLAGHETYYGIHKLIPNKEPRYITFLRDPAERLVSQYNHYMTQARPQERISFNEWYNRYPKNEMTRFFSRRFNTPRKKIQRSTFFLRIFNFFSNFNFWRRFILFSKRSSKLDNQGLEKAKILLDKCWFVGITKNLNNDLKFLAKEMKISNNWELKRVSGNKKSWMNLSGQKKVDFSKTLFKIDKEIKNQIHKDNPLDVKLYEYAKQLNKKFINHST